MNVPLINGSRPRFARIEFAGGVAKVTPSNPALPAWYTLWPKPEPVACDECDCADPTADPFLRDECECACRHRVAA